MKKIFTAFGSGTNVKELSKGLFCSLELLEQRAQDLHDVVIQSQIVSERKIRDFLNLKYRYSTVKQELLLIHMKNNKIIEVCQVTITDDNTGEEVEHRAAYSLSHMDKSNQKNMKVFELEINLYSLSDAIKDIEDIKARIKQKVTDNAEEGKKMLLTELFKNVVYAEEVWINIAKSITMIEEQLQVFDEVSEITLQLLIKQSRRDLFFFEKCKQYLNKCLEDRKEEKEIFDTRATQTIQKLSLPQWIRKVEINEEEIEKDISLLLAEKWVQDTEDLLKDFMKKVKIDIKLRESLNIARRSPQRTEVDWAIPSSYMDTIIKFQEFFEHDEHFEPTNNTTNPFEVKCRVSRLRKDEEQEEEVSPDVRRSVVVQFDNYAEGDFDSSDEQ